LQHIDNGRIKQFLIWRAVELRRGRETVFRDGDYVALHVIAR
jgi:maltooligosyltrehalose synthase